MSGSYHEKGSAKTEWRPNLRTMITCERCGNVMPNSSLLCLVCGTLSVLSRPDIHTPVQNESGSVPFPIPGEGQKAYEQWIHNPQPDYAPSPGEQPYDAPSPLYPVRVSHSTTTPIASITTSSKKGALYVEVVLNLCLGIFGIGWLIAGENVTGLVLLACSVIVYWPTLLIVFFLNVTFSIGPGLYGLVPLALGVSSLNILLLKKVTRCKTIYEPI